MTSRRSAASSNGECGAGLASAGELTGTVVCNRAADFFADGVVATAILDRLLHHATVVNIKGQSYRMRAHVPQPGSAREGAAMLG